MSKTHAHTLSCNSYHTVQYFKTDGNRSTNATRGVGITWMSGLPACAQSLPGAGDARCVGHSDVHFSSRCGNTRCAFFLLLRARNYIMFLMRMKSFFAGPIILLAPPPTYLGLSDGYYGHLASQPAFTRSIQRIAAYHKLKVIDLHNTTTRDDETERCCRDRRRRRGRMRPRPRYRVRARGRR